MRDEYITYLFDYDWSMVSA